MGKQVIIGAPNWIGDAVISTSLFPIIKENLPESSLFILCKKKVRAIFERNPYVEEILHPENGRKIKEKKFALGILLTNSFSSALLMRRLGVKERVGYPTDGRRFLLTRRVSLPQNWRRIPQIEFYLRILDSLGMKRKDTKPQLYLEKEEMEKVKENFHLPEKFVALIPGAAYGSAKRWPVENFAGLSLALTQEFFLPVVILGSEEEKKLGDEITAVNRETFNLVGKTSLREMMSIISLSSLVVCNDSGALHVASALEIPVIGIYGPTPVEKTKPWYGKVRTIYRKVDCSPCEYRECPRDHRCMKSINIEDVLELVRELLKQDEK